MSRSREEHVTDEFVRRLRRYELERFLTEQRRTGSPDVVKQTIPESLRRKGLDIAKQLFSVIAARLAALRSGKRAAGGVERDAMRFE